MGGRRLHPGLRRLDAHRARLCYDHLAGQLGVTITGALQRAGLLSTSPDGKLGVAVTAWDAHPPLGITTTAVKGRRSLARGCVDWTARRPHLAGALGAALAHQMFQDGWITRPVAGQRALSLTSAGKAGVITAFGVPEGELADVPLSGASR